MTIEEQILQTEEELNAYKASKFSAPEIVQWLEAVLESLNKLKTLS